MKKLQNQDSKHSFGGGSFYNLLNKDIKELNTVILSLFIIIFLFSVGFISYKITNSYALFSDSVEGVKTIGISVAKNECYVHEANAPVLDSNMIPVYYDESSSSWKKADSSNKDYSWYDYCEKRWANSVTVSSTSRSKYLSASVGTEISMDDILTMEVWIPRYKYKVFNYNSDGTKISSPQQIEITFENDNESTGEITCSDSISGTDGKASETCKLKESGSVCTDSLCNNKTYTHPGFTFGDEELNGFWTSKFELTGLLSSITSKPNLISVGSKSVSDYETNIMKMKNSNNSYGFSTNVDTHMIKNIEWGAVAYLSHSKYGTCSGGSCVEIGINNNSNYLTGCGATAGSAKSSVCDAYNTSNGMLASTTFNIYGVYDFSGGTAEYTMANIVGTDGKTMISNSSGISTYPNAKYYDKYSYSGNNSDAAKIKSKLGDGIKEMFNDTTNDKLWYGDSAWIAHGSNAAWFTRGAGSGNGSSAGVFTSSCGSGAGEYAFIATRFIIVT